MCSSFRTYVELSVNQVAFSFIPKYFSEAPLQESGALGGAGLWQEPGRVFLLS